MCSTTHRYGRQYPHALSKCYTTLVSVSIATGVKTILSRSILLVEGTCIPKLNTIRNCLKFHVLAAGLLFPRVFKGSSIFLHRWKEASGNFSSVQCSLFSANYCIKIWKNTAHPHGNLNYLWPETNFFVTALQKSRYSNHNAVHHWLLCMC